MLALCWRKKLCSCINKIILPNNSTTTRERSWMIEGKKRQAIRRHSGIIMWSGPRNMLGQTQKKKRKEQTIVEVNNDSFCRFGPRTWKEEHWSPACNCKWVTTSLFNCLWIQFLRHIFHSVTRESSESLWVCRNSQTLQCSELK